MTRMNRFKRVMRFNREPGVMRYVRINGEEIEILERNRFSRFIPSESHPDMDLLRSWRLWFALSGINSEVVHVAGKGYAVYRNGLVDTRKREVA